MNRATTTRLVRGIAAADSSTREVNPEGLTWPEWWRAARLTAAAIAKSPGLYLDAWRRGQAPSEYAGKEEQP